jgi:phosphoglycerol transferase MdoB-like AlkP superfamily enzyme
MLPHFETVALFAKARSLTHPMPHVGGWALASVSMGVGVGATALALYALGQDVAKWIATLLWAGTGFLFLLALILWRLRSQTRSLYDQRVDEFCAEVKMLVQRYGGETADSVVAQLEAIEVLPEHRSLRNRLRRQKPVARTSQ